MSVINKASNYLPVNFLSKHTCTDSPGHLDVVHFSENSRVVFFGGVGVIGFYSKTTFLWISGSKFIFYILDIIF